MKINIALWNILPVRKFRLFGMLIIVIVFIGSFGSITKAQSSSSIDSEILLTSRFILWDESEKMIDKNFNINIICFNQIENKSNYYNISIDDIYYDGYFDNFYSIPINITSSNIGILIIKINNETVFTAYNIIITENINGSAVKRSISEYLISLNPLEWTAKEYNIFYSGCISFILSVFFGYQIAKYLRNKRGVTEIG